jgi:hypothetical protein
MLKTTSPELRKEAIEAVRTQAHLALSDQYLSTSKSLPLWLGGGLAALVFLGNLGAIGVSLLFFADRLFAYQTYGRKRAVLRSTTSAKAILEPLKRNPEEYRFARAILQAKGDLAQLVDDDDETENGGLEPESIAASFQTESGLLREVPISWVPKAKGQGEHLALIGLSGASKTTTLIKACEGIQTPIIYLTIKDADTAPPNWEAYKLSKTAGEYYLAQLSHVCDRIEDMLTAGKEHHLIVDEALQQIDQAKDSEKLPEGKAYKGTANRFESLIKCYIRSGRSDGQLIGLVSQSPNGTDLFGSAKTLQGLKLILCAGEYSSNKFQFFPDWAKQLFGKLVTPEIEQELRTIKTGFWHLTNTGDGLALNQTHQSNVAMVPCQDCPAGDAEAPTKPAGPSPMRQKATAFIAEHEGPARAAWEAGQERGAIAYAYCGLLQDCLSGPVPLSGFGSKSKFVWRLHKAGVIETRARDEWAGYVQELINKGYVRADGEKLWID